MPEASRSSISEEDLPSTLRRMSVVCSPSAGGKESAPRGLRESLMGLPRVVTEEPFPSSSSTTISRWSTCGEARARSRVLTMPTGMPALLNSWTHSAASRVRKAGSMMAHSSSLCLRRSRLRVKRGSSISSGWPSTSAMAFHMRSVLAVVTMSRPSPAVNWR